jgi:hypothetical protein
VSGRLSARRSQLDPVLYAAERDDDCCRPMKKWLSNSVADADPLTRRLASLRVARDDLATVRAPAAARPVAE